MDIYTKRDDKIELLLEKLNEEEVHGAITGKYVADNIKIPALQNSLQATLMEPIWNEHGD